MTDQERQAFLSRYADLAMEQQRRYGIPASLTLAQLALESGWGTGRAFLQGNNLFCVKAGSDWKGPVIYITDNTKNERFRQYANAEASFEDHSKVLMKDTYKQCHSLSSTDYKGWAMGLQSGRMTYAYNPAANDPYKYSRDLISVIEKYNLQQYDVLALQTSTRNIGYMRQVGGVPIMQENGRVYQEDRHYHMPFEGSYAITSDYGTRIHPVTGKVGSEHKAIDVGMQSNTPLFVTEDGGRVIEAGWKENNGNFVNVEYNRGGDTYQVMYLHMNKLDVKVGDIVNAGDRIGLSGATGRVTGAHLDFRVKKNGDYINPKEYLAEIAVRSGAQNTLKSRNGEQDLLASYKEQAASRVMAEQEALLAHQSQQQQLGGQADFNQQQLSNIEKANMLKDKLNSGDPAELMGMVSDGHGDDIIASLLGMMLTAVVPLMAAAMGGTDENGNTEGESATVGDSSSSERKEDESSLTVHRSNPVDAAALASVNFETNSKSLGTPTVGIRRA